MLEEHSPEPWPGGAGRSGGLRVGIDGTCLALTRGYGRFLREVLPPLLAGTPHDYTLFLDAPSAARLNGLPPLRLVRPRTSRSQAEAAAGRRSLADLWRMGRAVARERLDVVLFPTVYSYFPVPSRVPLVIGFHDTIAERHGRVVFPNRRARWLWAAKTAVASRQARVVLTVSERSSQRLTEVFGLAPHLVVVAPEAPATVFQPVEDRRPLDAWLRQRGLPPEAPYFLYVGGLNPHKNLAALVAALARSAQEAGTETAGQDPARHGVRRDDSRHPPARDAVPTAASAPRLYLAGDHEGDLFHADAEALRRQVDAAGLSGRVAFLGFVPDDALRYLYAGALALVLPSLEEGFGLPAVEAAACGTPCVATTESPLPDLLEGGGLFVPPRDVAGLAAALDAVRCDAELRADLGRRARQRAAALSWEATAAAVATALEIATEGRQ